MIRKIAALTAASAVLMVECSAGFQGTAESEADSGRAVKIMAIGDSITDGYGIGGSYRKFLFHSLEEKGFLTDMVGAKGGGWTPSYTDEITGETFEYDDENTGYSGYSIQSYSGRNGIYETLQSTGCLASEPDIVILQIGTNDVIDNHDIEGAGERLRELIGYILDNISEESVLFVTTIPNLSPNRAGVYDWFSNYRHEPDNWNITYTDDEVEVRVQENVDRYNGIVRETVENLGKSYDNLCAGDINSVINDVENQLADGVHPNNIGYRLMGEYWAEMLVGYLGGDSGKEKLSISDAVQLTKFLLGDDESGVTAENSKKYDLDGNGRLDSFDLAKLKNEIINRI